MNRLSAEDRGLWSRFIWILLFVLAMFFLVISRFKSTSGSSINSIFFASLGIGVWGLIVIGIVLLTAYIIIKLIHGPKSLLIALAVCVPLSALLSGALRTLTVYLFARISADNPASDVYLSAFQQVERISSLWSASVVIAGFGSLLILVGGYAGRMRLAMRATGWVALVFSCLNMLLV